MRVKGIINVFKIVASQMLKLRITAADAVKDKEDTELKCQQKISDMVTLMEKHKVGILLRNRSS